jgi:predicted transcriptional regulator
MTDLNERQRALLTELAEVQPITAPDLARSLGESVRWVQSTLKRLKERGLVVSDSYQRTVRIWAINDEPQD